MKQESVTKTRTKGTMRIRISGLLQKFIVKISFDIVKIQ